jgi:hypothetical protein
MKIVKRPESTLNTDYVERLVEDYKKAREALATFEKRTNDIKKELSELVVEHGIADDKGSLWMEVGDFKLKRERRVSRFLDIEGATAWAKENNFWYAVVETVEQFSEDKFLKLGWENDDIAEAINAFYIEKETWAFKA